MVPVYEVDARNVVLDGKWVRVFEEDYRLVLDGK